MKTTTRKPTPIKGTTEGDWLVELLTDVQREVATQPSPGAVARMRERLFAGIAKPEKAAA